MSATEDKSDSSSIPTERFAVIAVHGVGDQREYDSARAVTEMLSRDLPANFPAFTNEEISIPVRYAGSGAGTAARRPGRFFGFDPQSRNIHQAIQNLQAAHPPATPSFAEQEAVGNGAARRVMDEQLHDYVPGEADQVYHSIRYKGVYKKKSGRTAETHVYEMYWGDLARVGAGPLKGFFELYHLLFDVCMLGRRAIDSVRQIFPALKGWCWLSRFQRIVESLLSRFIFPLNVLALAMAGIFALGLVPASWVLVAFAKVAPGVLVVGAVAFFFARRNWGETVSGVAAMKWAWAFPLVLIASVGGGVFAWMLPCEYVWNVAATSAFTVIALVYGYAMRVYELRRPRSLLVSGIAAVVCGYFLLHEVWTSDVNSGPQAMMHGALYVIEGLFASLSVVWVLLWITALPILFSSLYVRPPQGADPLTSQRLSRSLWTVVVATLLPLLLTMVTNASLWGAVHFLLNKLVENDKAGCVSVTQFAQAWPWFAYATSLSLPVALGALIIAGLWSGWALFPSISREFGSAGKSAPMNNFKNAKGLGRALCGAFATMRFIGGALRWSAVFAVLAILVLTALRFLGWELVPVSNLLTKISLSIGGLVVLGLLIGHGPLKFLSAGFHAVLDVAVDVTVWFRTRPLETSARARICARYLALLKHLGDWRGADGRGYDKIVIVAHSQGSVITAELLWYLAQVPTAQRPIHKRVILFTMGSPLRQIYEQRFPFMYLWAYSDAVPSSNPCLANVEKWVNAYGAGDYVGRFLWGRGSVKRCGALPCCSSYCVSDRWSPRRTKTATHAEFCVGYTAHTKYWHAYSTLISNELSQLLS